MENAEQNRITEIISELSSCREDERNAYNQILQVIAVVGTILGILYGASFLPKNPGVLIQTDFSEFKNMPILYKMLESVKESLVYTRIIFLLSILVFIVAFTYVLVLGLGNLMRYYYIQNLEDRLYELIPATKDNNYRGSFLHWNAYYAPINTQNFFHAASPYTVLNQVCLMFAICGIVLFSMGLIGSLFLRIPEKNIFDYAIILIVACMLIFVLGLYLYSNRHARQMVQFSWNIAHDNQKVRLSGEGKTYDGAEKFRKRTKYYFYPKTQDLQKPLLVAIGFIFANTYYHIPFEKATVLSLLFTLFVFEFLIYQARYQINDIRGIQEDKEAGHTNRLLSGDEENVGRRIKLSFGIAIVKIFIATILTVMFGNDTRVMLFICFGLVLLSSISYELARAYKKKWLVFILVGIGYPLRFFVGYLTAVPENWKDIFSIEGVCFSIAMIAYGSFASILVWCSEITKRMVKFKEEGGEFPERYEKAHYLYLQKFLASHFYGCKSEKITSINPLIERGKLTDPWNIMFLLSMILMSFIQIYMDHTYVSLLIEVGISLIGILGIITNNWKKALFCLLSIMVVAVRGIFLFVDGGPLAYLLFWILRGIMLGTYTLLCFQPFLKAFDKVYGYRILKKIVGDYAFEQAWQGKDERSSLPKQ